MNLSFHSLWNMLIYKENQGQECFHAKKLLASHHTRRRNRCVFAPPCLPLCSHRVAAPTQGRTAASVAELTSNAFLSCNGNLDGQMADGLITLSKHSK